MPVDPREILGEIAPDAVPAEKPPEVANYREADIHGIACTFCSKFCLTGMREAQVGEGEEPAQVSIPMGVCDQWEANVDGVFVCDRFASGAPAYDENGNARYDSGNSPSDEVDFSDDAVLVDREFFLPADEGLELSAEDNLVWKDILREGEWDVTPTLAGQIKKPLRIVAEGKTDYLEGVIAMSDIEAAFNDGAVQYVQIPLTDEPGKDHKEMARLNQGFVKKLKRVVGADGKARLRAGMFFTEPETREKVLRGTYADVSAKITPFIRKRDSKKFLAALRHVCITNTPYIDGMAPFGVAASDEAPSVVESYQLAERLDENDVRLSLEWRKEKATEALHAQLALSDGYEAIDIVGPKATIRHDLSDTTWTAPYELTADGVKLSVVDEWEMVQNEGTPPPETPAKPSTREETPLEMARRLRGLRLSQADTTNGGSNMPRTGIEELDGLELSDDARAVIQRIVERNKTLEQKDKEKGVNTRLEELKGLGFSDFPGFLKFYRNIALADDDMPVIEFSDDDGKKVSPSAIELLDQAIDALSVNGKVHFELSQQADNDNGNNDKPPVDDDGDKTPVDQRVAETRAALGIK